jgi:hypothetical protein
MFEWRWHGGLMAFQLDAESYLPNSIIDSAGLRLAGSRRQ